MRSQNSELFGRINAFKKEMSLKNSTIENLVAEKREINKELEGTRKKLNAIEVCLETFSKYFFINFFIEKNVSSTTRAFERSPRTRKFDIP